MFSKSKTEAKPKAEIGISCWAKPMVVESSDSEPKDRRAKARHDVPAPRAAPTRKRTRSHTSQTSHSLIAFLVEMGREKTKVY